jgi:hypothetical protein
MLRYWRVPLPSLLDVARSRRPQPGSVPAQLLEQQQLHRRSGPWFVVTSLLAEIRTPPPRNHVCPSANFFCGNTCFCFIFLSAFIRGERA